jgi:hypothetical protein
MEACNLQQTESPAFGDLLGEPRKLKTLTPQERTARVAFFSRRIDAVLRRGAARDLILTGNARFARIQGELRPRQIRLVMDDQAGETQLLLSDEDELGRMVSLDQIEDAYPHARDAAIAVEIAARGGAL